MESVIDIAAFLSDPERALEDCKKVVDSFKSTGILVIRDPRVTFSDNATFIDMMEDYYNLENEKKKKDARPEFHYQVGTTPEFTEVPRDNAEVISKLHDDQKPTPLTGADPKWRFFWPIGERPKETKFPRLNMPQVIPESFPNWEAVMNKWASLILQACITVADMLARGLDLPHETFTKMMKFGPHLLAPTGSDLGLFNKPSTVFAGFHYDLNFLTIHGKSRYPGLFVWLRNGTRSAVKIPDGCLLLQAGKQLEWLTGGLIEAGYHEVVVNDETLKALERQKEAGRPTWRVSSTLFSHIGSDEVLEPLKEEWKNDKYPPTLTGDQVSNELKQIKLGKTQEVATDL
ncbi:gibberellin 20 oxidase [Acrasis kona]|uniref:Gibberellin 20 oxidase n=1 Tax=Acrasis kona TaxID=1008807 RepID=A0AAW2ZKZ0_9EUKA